MISANQIANTVRDIRIEARLVALRWLARDTALAYDRLVRHGVPPALAHDYFAVEMLRQRLDEERDREIDL
ncbi:hypothetical protein [uncultured Bradyrhizobium sp.]|uniref:hypothetical protein n=1 Tax=Bradyrhizobium sp. TaxID=376 RepID=UPI00262CA997|nr:hypothetical protein [uncultured Bradyrhizobium sp.]